MPWNGCDCKFYRVVGVIGPMTVLIVIKLCYKLQTRMIDMFDMSINSIYMATEGEGIFIGTPQIFVRFQGCAIGCLNCDSKETWSFDAPNMTLASTVEEIENLAGNYPYRIKRVSITGGDPMHPKLAPSVERLSIELKKRGYFVNIEASGQRIVDKIFDIVDFVSFDLKTPSTGVKTNLKVLNKLVDQYSQKSQLKAVVADKKDFEFVFDVFNQINKESEKSDQMPWVITPCYEPGEDFPKERFISIQNYNQQFGSPFRVIGQQHKWIFGPNKTQV